ncbi:MAG: hypothetical protein HPY53_11010 [Brevinematales bacterium]|nr:hypothetical protein [Brevinematales bacterium]
MRLLFIIIALFSVISCARGGQNDSQSGSTNLKDTFMVEDCYVDDRESKNPELDGLMEQIYSNYLQLVIAYDPEDAYDQRWFYDNEFFSVGLGEHKIAFFNVKNPKAAKIGKKIINITPLLLESAGLTSKKGYILVGYPDSSETGYNLFFVDKSGLDAGLAMNRFFGIDLYNTNQEKVQ